MAQPRLTVLISGSGSNLQAIIDACSAEQSPLQGSRIVRVISDRKAAYGLTRAQSAGIQTSYHPLPPYKKRFPQEDGKTSPEARAEYGRDLAGLVVADKPDLVVCAGFMQILSKTFLQELAQANIDIINLHPSLPGDDALVGDRAIIKAHEACERGERTETGVMIHYVIEDVDRGEPIEWRKIDMRRGEPIESLEERIHAVEHVAIVEGVRKALSRRSN